MEGTTERVLMPRICRIVDEDIAPEKRLGRQYITTIEVGGAHAHLFYPLLDSLELKSLIVTDIDAVRVDDTKEKKRAVECPCAIADHSSNTAIRRWFELKKGEQIGIDALTAKTPEDKCTVYRRIAYQIPEDGSVWRARSYEDALILANPAHFQLPADGDLGTIAWEMAQDLSKSETALRFAIQEQHWTVPGYLREGLAWLAEPPPPPEAAPPLPDQSGDEVAIGGVDVTGVGGTSGRADAQATSRSRWAFCAAGGVPSGPRRSTTRMPAFLASITRRSVTPLPWKAIT